MDAVTAQKAKRLRYSVSLVRQGAHSFYTLTLPSDVLARTCVVSTRKEDPISGFQRVLDKKRAEEIANYIDSHQGTIPNSIVLSAQPAAKLRVVGGGKTLEFEDTSGAFLILDGQHRVYGFALSKSNSPLRVPVVIYNNLTRTDESRLFIDINTKQRPVPPQLLLDIKQLANIETDAEGTLREIFDMFDQDMKSSMSGLMAPFENTKNKITRVTFNYAIKPLLELFAGRTPPETYTILNNYISAISTCLKSKTVEPLLGRAVVFRAFMALFPTVVQRVQDKFSGDYSSGNFYEVIAPIFPNITMKKIEAPGTSWTELRSYLEGRLKKKMVI